MVVVLLTVANVVGAVVLNSNGNLVMPCDNSENSGDTELIKPYENARNQFCEKPKGEKGCVDDSQGRTCTYTIFCLK